MMFSFGALLAIAIAPPPTMTTFAVPAAAQLTPEPTKSAYRPIEVTMDVPASVLPVPLSEFGTADASGLATGTINPWLYLRVTAVVTPPAPHQPFQLAGFFKGDGTKGDPCDGFIDDGRSFGARLSPENWQGTWTVQMHLESGMGSDGRPINVSNDAFPSPTATLIHSLPAGYVFSVVGPNPMASGFRSKGFLRVDQSNPYPYYSFSNPTLPDREKYFLKTGIDSPENFLAYEGFWETDKVAGLGIRHNYLKTFEGTGHLDDAPNGAPTWPTRSWSRLSGPRTLWTFSNSASCGANEPEAGRAIAGAIQYLSNQGMNSLYMLPMNLGGDGRDVHPFAVIPENEPSRNTPSDRQLLMNYSVKRMQEWNTVFQFANRKGLMLQFVLHEQERPNVEWLGYSPELGANPSEAELRSMTWARRLYLKQMVAHFGHNLGVKWNLCEENTWGESGSDREFFPGELRAMAEWIERWDAYADHPITVHTDPVRSNSNNGLDLYTQILSGAGGDWLDATSFQIHAGEVGGGAAIDYDYPANQRSFGSNIYGDTVQNMSTIFANAGRKGVIDVDEQGSPQFGSSGRHEDPAEVNQWLSWGASPNGRRRLVLYQALFSGGGIEFYFGGSESTQFPEYGGGDHVANEFRSRGKLWESCFVARRVLTVVPEFWTMVPNHDRVSGEYGSFMGQALVFENADLSAGRGLNYHAVYYPQIREKDLLSSPVVLGTIDMAHTAGSGISYSVTCYDPVTGVPIGTSTTIEPNGVSIDPTQLSGYVVPTSNDLLIVITQV